MIGLAEAQTQFWERIFIAEFPWHCYILQGRLRQGGIDSIIVDECILLIHPFYSVAIGGAKLAVPLDKVGITAKIMDLIEEGKLEDDQGEYLISDVFQAEIEYWNEILRIKSMIRKDPTLIKSIEKLEITALSFEEMQQIVDEEAWFDEMKRKRFDFTWKDFWFNLLDPEGEFIKYLRIKPVEYYLEKELTENYEALYLDDENGFCPYCGSTNFIYGPSTGLHLDLLFLIISLLLFFPIPWKWRRYHCFDCHNHFSKKDLNGITNIPNPPLDRGI